MADDTNILDFAKWYLSTGLRPIPVPFRRKGPVISQWQKLHLTPETLPDHFNGKPQNIGILLGEASGVVDIDLDCPEAIQLAPHFLPPTDFRFGRKSKPASHRFYACNPVPKTRQFIDVAQAPGPDGRPKNQTLVELRSTGGQTIVPPSVHESDETITFELADPPAQVNGDDLLHTLSRLAAACLLVRHWPGVGARHHFSLALTGALVRAGWAEEDIRTFTEIAARCAGDGETADRVRTAEYSVKRIASEQSATGWPTVARYIGTHGDAVITKVRDWLGISVEPAAARVEYESELVRIAPTPSPFPESAKEGLGLTQKICRWINDTALQPQPILALGNTLAFVGAVAGRKIRTSTDARTNIYALGVAPSGSGKDHSRKCIKKICEAAGLTAEILGGEDISSDSALLKAVYKSPSMLFQFDEIGHWLTSIKGWNAQGHQRAICPTFTKLFSSASTRYLGKEYAGRETERQDIEQPNACVYGTSVAEKLWASISQSDLDDGFLGRFLIFASETPAPDFRDERLIEEPPAEIVETVKAWWHRRDLPQAEGNVAAVVRHIPHTIEMDREATARLRQFRAFARDYQNAAGSDSGLAAVWSRAYEHAAKLALVLSVDSIDVLPEITASTMVLAIDLTTHLVGSMVRSAFESVASSDWERDLLYVAKKLRASGEEGMSLTQLISKTRKLAPRTRNEIVNHMVNHGEAQRQERKGRRGPAGEIYIMSEFLK